MKIANCKLSAVTGAPFLPLVSGCHTGEGGAKGLVAVLLLNKHSEMKR
jgi:hypothetical protein